MKNLGETKINLKKLLIKGIPPVLSELKGLLPSDSDKANDVLLLEGRLNAENKKLLRGTITNEQLQLAYNQIRSDLMDLIDSIEEKDFTAKGAKKDKKGAQKGELLYRIPDEMQLEEETKCIVRIALDDEEIIKNIELDKHVALKELSRVSNLMQVSLMDPNEDAPFAIRTISEPEQLIFEDGYTEWTFYVKPLKEGKFPLVIKVAVIELVFNKERKREIVFEEKINVSTTAVSDDALKAPFKKSKESFVLGEEEEKNDRSPLPVSKVPKILGMVLILVISAFAMTQFIPSNIGSGGGEFAMEEVEAVAPRKYDIVEETIHKDIASADVKSNTFRTVDDGEYRSMTRAASIRTTKTPASFETTTERVFISKQRASYQCIPPAFTVREKRILVEERLKKEGRIKPQFEISTKEVEIKPKVTVYECVEPEFEIEEIPYEKIGERIIKKMIPAKIERRIDTIAKGYSQITKVAATYEQIEKEIEIEPSTTRWVLEKNENCNNPDIQKCMDWKQETIPAKKEKISGWKFVSCPDGYDYDGKSCEYVKEIPPKTVSSQILIEPAKIEEEILPARMATYKTKVYQVEKRPEEKLIPAEFKKIETKLIVNKQDYSPDNIEQIYKTVEVKVLTAAADYAEKTIPAVYATITKRIESSPMQIINNGVEPASYETVKRKRVIKEEKIIPIEYPTDSVTIKVKKIVDPGGDKIKVKALKNPSEKTIKTIQGILKKEGFYKGTITGKLNPETLTALSLYQNEYQLPIGVLDEETLRNMKIIE